MQTETHNRFAKATSVGLRCLLSVGGAAQVSLSLLITDAGFMPAQSARSQLLAEFEKYKEANLSNIEIEVFILLVGLVCSRSVVVRKTTVNFHL